MVDSQEEARLMVNGQPVPLALEKGFARIRRVWQPGDQVELNLPMPIRRVLSHDKVADNAGRVALERGPIVYCAEGIDNGGQVSQLILPDEAELRAEHRPDMLNRVTVIYGKAMSLDGEAQKEQEFLAIPYYAWSHRGVGEMAVWLPRKV
jgi:DUF1680 family protein